MTPSKIYSKLSEIGVQGGEKFKNGVYEE